MRAFSLQRHRLRPGEALHRYVKKGSVIHLVTGYADVALPLQWLAETSWQDRRCLRAGDVLTVETRGWITLSAREETWIGVSISESAPLSFWVGAVLKMMLQRLRKQ